MSPIQTKFRSLKSWATHLRLHLLAFHSVALLALCQQSHAELPDPDTINGSFSVEALKGPISGQDIPYTLYLPPGYNTSEQDYSVLWHLHGLNGNHESQVNVLLPSYESALADGVIRPLIIVFPGVGRNSMWADTRDSSLIAETNVIKELLPYIDETYRTIDHRNRRAISGFSMGGCGAVLYGAKFPNLFSVAINYDGAMHTLTSLKTRRPEIAELFENDEKYFSRCSPWKWTSDNADTLRSKVAFRAAVGSLHEMNRSFRDHMQALEIPYDYSETLCGHALHCIYSHQGAANWEFIEKNFAENSMEGDPTL